MSPQNLSCYVLECKPSIRTLLYQIKKYIDFGPFIYHMELNIHLKHLSTRKWTKIYLNLMNLNLQHIKLLAVWKTKTLRFSTCLTVKFFERNSEVHQFSKLSDYEVKTSQKDVRTWIWMDSSGVRSIGFPSTGDCQWECREVLTNIIHEQIFFHLLEHCIGNFNRKANKCNKELPEMLLLSQ